MSYALIFYSLPPAETTPDPDPDSVALHIATHGTQVGEMLFRAAECPIFLDAVRQLTNQSAMRLLQAPLFGIEPPEEDPIFGGISRKTAEALAAALDRLLTPGAQPASYGECPRILRETPAGFAARLTELRDLLRVCLANPGDIVTRYE